MSAEASGAEFITVVTHPHANLVLAVRHVLMHQGFTTQTWFNRETGQWCTAVSADQWQEWEAKRQVLPDDGAPFFLAD